MFRRGALRRPGLRPIFALLALTLAFFGLLLLDGMPNERYLIVPTWLLILLAARAATPELRGRSAVAVGAGALLTLQVIVYWHAPLQAHDNYVAPVSEVANVKELLARPDIGRMVDDCQHVTATSYRQVWAYWSGRRPGTIRLESRPASTPDVYIVPSSERVAERILRRWAYDDDATFTVPAEMRPAAVAGAWRIYLNPSSPCAAGR